jgi:lysophospholipase L1-like esterase
MKNGCGGLQHAFHKKHFTMKNYLFPAMLALLLAATFSCKHEPGKNSQAGLLPRGDTTQIDRFENEVKEYEAADKLQMPAKGGVLFVGSSSIRLWTTVVQDFAPLPVISRGIGGSTTPEVIHYADRIVYKYEPSVIVYYCGENDMAQEAPAQVAFQNFKKFIGETEKRLPNTGIVVISAKPSASRWHLWKNFQQFNTMVEQFAKSRPNMRYVDVTKELLGSNGEPDPSLFVEDKLHLNASGYAKWTAVLKPVVMEVYNSKTVK